MPTFSQLKTKIARKLIDPNSTAVSLANVGEAINDAIRFWRYNPLWFNEATATVTLVVGDPVVPSIPSDFLFEDEENGFVILYNQISYSLKKKHPKEYDLTSIQNAVGLPYIYTWRNGVYSVYYNPNLAYTMNIYYIKNYVDLVADGDSNDFTNYADQLIVYEALSRLTGEDRQDTAVGDSYFAKANREFENLKKRSRRHSATGRLTVETIN
jgi:hypothetical protein